MCTRTVDIEGTTKCGLPVGKVSVENDWLNLSSLFVGLSFQRLRQGLATLDKALS